MADMSGENVTIDIGAKSSVAETTDGIIAEFDRMAAMLRKVGTEDARGLEKSLQSAMAAIKSGISPNELGGLAVTFEKVRDASELSDNAITGLAEKMKAAVKNSRQLSDAMTKASNASRVKGAMLDALDKIAPKAAQWRENIRDWASKIPVLDKMMARMPDHGARLAAAIGLVAAGFGAVALKVKAAYERFVEFQNQVTESREKFSRWGQEDADETKKKKVFEIEQEERKRKDEERKAQALADADHLANIARAKKAHEDAMRNGGDMALPFMRDEEEMKFRHRTELGEKDKSNADIQRSITAKTAELESIERRRKAAEERKKALEADMKARSADMDMLEEARSESVRRAEAKAKEQGLEGAAFSEYVESHGMDSIGDALGDAVKDFGAWSKRVGAFFGIETSGSKLSTEEATKLFEARQEKMREQQRQLAEANREIAGYDADKETIGRDKEILERQKSANEAEREAVVAAQEREKTQKGRERDMEIKGTRVERMAEGNRLTAMGLGGGSTSYQRDVAGGVKNLVEITKEICANTRGEGRGTKELTHLTSSPTWMA